MRARWGSLAIGAAAFVGLTATNAPDPETLSPRTNYMLHCQGCHLADGSGMHGKVPDMRHKLGRIALMPAGRDYIGRVPGVANAPLTDAQLARVLNWLIPEMTPEVAGTFVPYSAKEIGGLRRNRLREVRMVRAHLLKQVEGQQAAR